MTRASCDVIHQDGWVIFHIKADATADAGMISLECDTREHSRANVLSVIDKVRSGVFARSEAVDRLRVLGYDAWLGYGASEALWNEIEKESVWKSLLKSVTARGQENMRQIIRTIDYLDILR